MSKPYVVSSIWILFLLCLGYLTELIHSKQCPENMIPFDGLCHKQIVGCAYYKSGTQCLKCQNNFNIYEGTCWISSPAINMFFLQNSYKEKNNNKKGESNPVQMSKYQSEKMEKIKKYLSSKYKNITFEENQPIIKYILPTPFQTYFSFTWINNKNMSYLFQISLNISEGVTQYLIQKFDTSLQISLFSQINANIVERYDKKMMNAQIFKIVPVSKNLYKLHYFSQFGAHFIAFIQKIPFLEIKALQTVPWQYNPNEIVDYVISQYNFFARQTQFAIQKKTKTKNPLYEITFGSQSKVVVEEFPAQAYRIIFLYKVQNMTVNQSSLTKLVGGYQIFKNNQDEILRKVLNHLLNQFKFLKLAQISKIEYQIVAGTNFLIHLQDEQNSNEYICKIFYSLSGEINILEIYLNSVLIHTQPLSPIQLDAQYDYKKDPVFTTILEYLKRNLNISLPQTILYVNRQQQSNQNDNFYKFDIVYEQNSFIVVKFYESGQKNGTTQIVDIIYNGDNLYEDIQISHNIIEIQLYLESMKRWLNPLLFQYIKQTKPNQYFSKVITQYGSYFCKVTKKDTGCYGIYYLQLIDDQENCMTFSKDEIIAFQQTQKQFLFQVAKDYKISSSAELSSFSKAIINSKTIYRLLYTNPKTKRQTQVILGQQGYTLGVQSVTDLNNGFELFDDLNLYTKTIEKSSLTHINVLKNAQALLGLKNSLKSRIYFISQGVKQTIYEVQIENKQQKSSIVTLLQIEKSKNCKKFDDKGYCSSCKQNQISLLSNCYLKIKNCFKQIGPNCMLCDDEFTLVDNKCTNDCKTII